MHVIAALPPVPAPGAVLVRVTTAAREAEAWAAAHEYDDPESAAAAEAHATEVAKIASAPTVMIIDKFPKFLTRKHLGTASQSIKNFCMGRRLCAICLSRFWP